MLNKLSGFSNGKTWNGTGVDSLGNAVTWSAEQVSLTTAKAEETKPKTAPKTGKSFYPFTAFGNDEENIPKQETILFKNATVWTSEKQGKLEGTDASVS